MERATIFDLDRETVPQDRPAPAYDAIAAFYDAYVDDADASRAARAYRTLVTRFYRSVITPGHRVLEIGSGGGDLLAAVEPSQGTGVDVSARSVELARERHPHLRFLHGAGEDLDLGETFDYVIVSDVVPYAHDLQALFESVARHCHPKTRVVLNTFSNLWRPVLGTLGMVGLRRPHPVRNWVGARDLANILEIAGLDIVAERQEVLFPSVQPAVATALNGVAARLPGVRGLTVSHCVIARPSPTPQAETGVSVIVPARNEAGNIRDIVERIPDMGTATEILFIEGHSSDDTRERIAQVIDEYPQRDIRLLVQTGKGKKNAVEEAFDAAKHETLMILDADMTVPPEDLPKFHQALLSGRGELINGTRLVYRMEPGAMRFINMIGNQVFAWLLTFVLGQYVRDTLCGTKVLRREDYERMRAHPSHFGKADPYGDFDLLLGAALLGLRIVNIPVRYGARTYGDTNIDRFPDSVKLAKLVAKGFDRIWVRPLVPRRGRRKGDGS